MVVKQIKSQITRFNKKNKKIITILLFSAFPKGPLSFFLSLSNSSFSFLHFFSFLSFLHSPRIFSGTLFFKSSPLPQLPWWPRRRLPPATFCCGHEPCGCLPRERSPWRGTRHVGCSRCSHPFCCRCTPSSPNNSARCHSHCPHRNWSGRCHKPQSPRGE